MRATKAEVAKRIEAVLRLRLAGAEFWDLREFAQSQDAETGKAPWGVSDDQLRRYVTAANDLMAQEMESRRGVLLARHLAQRHHLYAKAMAQGDWRVALAILQDEAKLQRLYLPENANALEELLAALPPSFAAEIRRTLAAILSPGAGEGGGDGK